MIARPPSHPFFEAMWDGSLSPALQLRDQTIVNYFLQQSSWGIDTSIDLYQCDHEAIRDPLFIRAFAGDLCRYIQMRPQGEPIIERFGDDPEVTGYTLVQLIQTSDIAAHFIEQSESICLNVFSCSPFPPYLTAAFCQERFGAQSVDITILFRCRRRSQRKERMSV